jgi:hypothetical protein
MEQVIDISYIPNKKQCVFHECDADEAVYGGAKGGGKSCALVMEALAYGLQHEGAEMYIFRETFDDLETNIIREWKEKVPKELYEYNESKHIARLLNGTTVKFRYIRNFQDAEGYQGRSMDWIGVDELTKHLKKSIQVLLSCLRSPKGFPTRFRATCNPGGVGHMWVKEDYIDATNYGEITAVDEVTDNRRVFIPAKVYDNDVLMKNDPNYVKRLENLPEAQKKAFLHGEWDIFEGQYFPEFKREIHVVKPFEIPSNWRRFRSLDYGMDMAACYWWAVDGDGVCYIYRELHESGLILSKAAKRIAELTPDGEKIEYTVASPDLWNKRQETGESGAEIMRKNGIGHMRKANNARIPGWRVMREYLKPVLDRYGNNSSRLKLFSNCVYAIKNIPQLIYDDKNVEDAASEPHEVTHACESIRYGIMSRPRLAERKAEADPDELTPEQKHRQMVKDMTGGSVSNDFINYG